MGIGLVKGRFDNRLLILYILSRTKYPVNEAELWEIAQANEGVGYFQFKDALIFLTDSENISAGIDDYYTITKKGTNNLKACEDEIARSVRLRCDEKIEETKRRLKIENLTRVNLIENSPKEQGFTVEMILDDTRGNLMTLNMFAPDKNQAERLAKAFKKSSEDLYSIILNKLLE